LIKVFNKLQIQTQSLPVVVTSHGSQEPTAVAAIMWDNAFAELGRIPFIVPPKVSWAELAQVISDKFVQLTGRGLTEDHLRFLKRKAFRGSAGSSEFLSWAEFCKDHLPERNFSFWEWLWGALRVLEKKETHLKELWAEGLITGFVDRETAEAALRFHYPGTFLLRFADSQIGGLTIVWAGKDGVVASLKPFDMNELTIKRFPDTIKELKGLRFLWPNGIGKEELFGKFYSIPGGKDNRGNVSPGKNNNKLPPYLPIVPGLPR
jgi:signal transducer and activator of transcription 5B